MRVRTRAPAKVNLRLRVHEREPSGFHRLETLFCAIELADEITLDVADGDGVRLEVDGPDLGPADRNLAVRAARGFLAAAGLRRDVAIRLRKRIPAGGGLGGGSSDAAAVLRALDRLEPGAVPPDQLRALALELGSDVPFFMGDSVLARAAGRGERLAPVLPLPSAPVLLLVPGFPIATADAYRWLDEDRARGLEAGPGPETPDPPAGPASWSDAARSATNDFEGPIFRRHPELRDLRDLLAGAGATLALLSGSGSSLFGVFADDATALHALALVRSRAAHVRLEPTRTATR